MSTTNGNLKRLRVTDKAGNVYILLPVDTDARQAIDEAKNINFDEDVFNVEETETDVNLSLNNVPFGVVENTPLEIAQDDENGLVLTSRALFGKAFCSEYNATSGTYSVGNYVVYQGKIYKCKTAIGTAEEFTASKWQEVVFIDYDLNDAPAFSTSSTYAVGKYCHCDGKLYVCTTAVTTSGAWDSSKWAEVERYVPDSISAALAQLADYVTKLSLAAEFDNTNTDYAVGDYCYKDGTLYKSLIAQTHPVTWADGNWQAVSRILTDLVSRLASYVKKYDLAEEYDEHGIYAIGDYCYHEGNLYRCKHAHSSGVLTAWDASHWDQINELLPELISKFVRNLEVANEYSNSSTYNVGDICYHNGSLYKCTTAITTAEDWTAAHWSNDPVTIDDVFIKKSPITGFVRNDGSIDPSTYLPTGNLYPGFGTHENGPMTQKAVYDYLGTHWYVNNTSGARWYNLLTVTNDSAEITRGGEIFLVGIRDADGRDCQAILAIESNGPNDELIAKLAVMNSAYHAYPGKVELMIVKNSSTSYTIYAKLGGNATEDNAVKITPAMCNGTISIGDNFEVSAPQGAVSVDVITNLFTTLNGGVGNRLQPVYVYEQGLVAPCSTANIVVALTDIGGAAAGDTSEVPIVEDNILVVKSSASHPNKSINIQRLVMNKVYKILFLTGDQQSTQQLTFVDYINSTSREFTAVNNTNSYSTYSYDMIAMAHNSSYTSHVMRTNTDVIYVIDGY